RPNGQSKRLCDTAADQHVSRRGIDGSYSCEIFGETGSQSFHAADIAIAEITVARRSQSLLRGTAPLAARKLPHVRKSRPEVVTQYLRSGGPGARYDSSGSRRNNGPSPRKTDEKAF